MEIINCHTCSHHTSAQTLLKLLPPLGENPCSLMWQHGPPASPLSTCTFLPSASGPRDGFWFKLTLWPHGTSLNSVCHLVLSSHTWFSLIFPETKLRCRGFQVCPPSSWTCCDPSTPRNLARGILSMLTCFFSRCLCAFAHTVFSSWNTCSRPTFLQLGGYPASSRKPS